MDNIEKLLIEELQNNNNNIKKAVKRIKEIFQNKDFNDLESILKLCEITVDKLFYLQRYDDIIYIKENIFNNKHKFNNINDILFLYPSAISNLMLGRYKKSIEELEELINDYELNNEQLPPLQNFLAEAYLREKIFDKAADTYEKIINLNNTNAMMWNDYGYALENIGKIEEAKNAYLKSLELEPSFIFAKRNLKKLTPKENLFKKIKKIFIK